MAPEISIIAVEGIPEVECGEDISALIISATEAQGTPIENGDILVVTQKIVSKAEGRVVSLADIKPSLKAKKIAQSSGKDPRLVELILRESRQVIRQARGVLITETKHGFICANAGVDSSNVNGDDLVALLPVDPDSTAAAICSAISGKRGGRVAVIISDSFGRPWREGQTNIAIGVAGMTSFVNYSGCTDPYGYKVRVSNLAVADELASAAELVMGKLSKVPVAIVRGFDYPQGEGSARELIRPPGEDLFR